MTQLFFEESVECNQDKNDKNDRFQGIHVHMTDHFSAQIGGYKGEERDNQ